MSSDKPSSSQSTSQANGGLPDEESRLDEAMLRADQLLVTSLKGDDRRRRQRKIILFSLGGLIMVTAICAMMIGFAGAPATEKLNPEQAAQIAQQGWKLWQQQDFDRAATKFEEAVKLDPKNGSAWNGLGWARLNGGNFAKAEAAFQKLVKMEPNHPAALNGLGQIALAQKKYGPAEKYLLKAARNEAPAAWYGLARLYLAKGQFDQAAKWAQKVVDSGDEDGSAAKILQAANAKKMPTETQPNPEPPQGAARAPVGEEVARAWQLSNQGRRVEAKAAFAALWPKRPPTQAR